PLIHKLLFQNLRETQKAKALEYASNNFFNNVLFPPPDGPEITTGLNMLDVADSKIFVIDEALPLRTEQVTVVTLFIFSTKLEGYPQLQ
uniref:Uncharacterized protein n=1 Tax=Romanomermis culicivorax TaxID=13658 RepID=A0A915JFT8_ROMCU